jgi:hypothetical protein
MRWGKGTATAAFAMAVALPAVVAAAGCGRAPLPASPAPDRAGVSDAGTPATSDAGAPDMGARDAQQACPQVEDATDWTEVIAPPELAGFTIAESWTAGRDDILFAGNVPVGPADQGKTAPRLVRWAHGCWSVELAPDQPNYYPASVSGTSASDIWAVAGPILEHNDGSGWSIVDDGWRALEEQAFPGGSGGVLQKVRAAGPEHVWVLSGNRLWHRQDGQWTVDVLPRPSWLREGQDGIAYETLELGDGGQPWVGGFIDTLGRIPDTAFLVHRDADAGWIWTGVGDGSTIALARDGAGGMWLSAADGGFNPPLFHTTGDSNGTSAVVTIDGWPEGSEAGWLWPRAPDDVWASGITLAHWDGQTWRTVTDLPMAGVQVGGDADTMWLVTRGPRFFRRQLIALARDR